MSNSIDSQGLSKVHILLSEIQFLAGSRIQKSPDPPNGVYRETAKLRSRTFKVCLQQAIDEADRKCEVKEKILDTYPCNLGNDHVVSLRYRLEHPEVKFIVEVVHDPVEGFNGIRNGYRHFISTPLLHICKTFFVIDAVLVHPLDIVKVPLVLPNILLCIREIFLVSDTSTSGVH